MTFSGSFRWVHDVVLFHLIAIDGWQVWLEISYLETLFYFVE